jgi:RNA polymerase sigma-70 factor (sigma-E family)
MDSESDFSQYLIARQRWLMRTAWLLTGDWHLAEDLVQTAMIKVWPHWSRIRGGGNPDAYVRRTLITTYASGRRRKWQSERPTLDLPDLASAPDSTVAVDLRDALRRVLPRLTPSQRAVVVLRYYEDLSEQQTADTLGCSVGTVKSQSSKALARLREALTDQTKVE